MSFRKSGDLSKCEFVVEHHFGILFNRLCEYGNAEATMIEACEVIDPARMLHTSWRDCLHTAGASFLTNIPGLVICQSQHVEACIAVLFRVSVWLTEQVAGVRIAAFLAWFAAVDQHAFEISESDIGSR